MNRDRYRHLYHPREVTLRQRQPMAIMITTSSVLMKPEQLRLEDGVTVVEVVEEGKAMRPSSWRATMTPVPASQWA
ncbi:hypothetical protein DYI26_20040 [Halomonas litopenaei]|nr:hypothetical protein [Halomonas litopenaei]